MDNDPNAASAAAQEQPEQGPAPAPQAPDAGSAPAAAASDPAGAAQSSAPAAESPAAGAAAAEAAEAPAPAPAPPQSLLGKAIAGLQEANRASHDRLLRMAADFDNYKKRTRKEQSDAVRRAEEKTIQELLPVMDNLERALSHAEPGGSLVEGVNMVHKQFLSVLERFGIKPFDSLGQPFDPERHEAIQQAASPQPPGIICMEAQRGYVRGDRLLRPALVVVSLGPVSTTPAGQAETPAPGSAGDVGTSEPGES